MSLLFNMLFRFAIAFLPKSKYLLISWLLSPSAVILEPQIYLPWSDGTGCHDLCFWMLSFKLAFSLSSFTFIKRLFSSLSLSTIRVVSSAYLRLLIFLPEILISACASSSLAFYIMFSSIQFSHSVMSDSLQPHGLQHTGLSCPSPTPEACSNTCLSSQWCHPTISSSSCPLLSQHQSLFQWVSSSHHVAKVLEFQLLHQSFQWYTLHIS